MGQNLYSQDVTSKDLVSPTVHLCAQFIACDGHYAPME